jgi:hypothetical protein
MSGITRRGFVKGAASARIFHKSIEVSFKHVAKSVRFDDFAVGARHAVPLRSTLSPLVSTTFTRRISIML